MRLGRVGLIAVVVLVLALVALPILGMAGGGMMGWGGHDGPGGWAGWGGGGAPPWALALAFVGKLLFTLALIFGAILLFRALLGGHGFGPWAHQGEAPSAGRETALEILRRRFANGEITREQFDEMKRTLEA